MKRIGNLFGKICDMDNLRKAHQHAKRGKGWYKEVKRIDKDPDTYLKQIQEMFRNHTYHTSEYEVFYKTEGKKERKIYKLPYFPDRIAQWAIIQVIEPYLIKNLIADTYSAIPKRGIHKGLHKLEHCLQTDPDGCMYCLKIDARHYYQNINHEILKAKFRRLFKDKDLLYLLDEIIDSINTIDEEDICEIWLAGRDYDPETGIPIGNYLSQYSGNFYFSAFDHWIKEDQKVKYYFRYMDDIVILSDSKEKLHQMRKDIDDYFRVNMKLRVKKNWQIFPTFVRGVDFLGYRAFEDYTLLRKSVCIDYKQKMVRIYNKCSSGKMMNYSEWCSVNSYSGWLKHADTFRLAKKYSVPLQRFIDQYYERVISPERKTA